jgi:hypothetical protein
MVKMSRDEIQWMAEQDANTMARYQEIIGDKKRMSRAIKVAEKQARSLSERASAMQNVARTKQGRRGK